MFTTLSQFISHAKAQNSLITKKEGIIFYYETDSIPPIVFLVPCKVKFNGLFSDFVIKKLENYSGGVTEIYFQGMRWGMPNLLEQFQKLEYLKCKRISLNDSFSNMRIVAGAIFIDANTYPRKGEAHVDNPEDFSIEFASRKFSFISKDYDLDKHGLPVFFEPFTTR